VPLAVTTKTPRDAVAALLCKVNADSASAPRGYANPYSADELWAGCAGVIREGYLETADAILALPGVAAAARSEGRQQGLAEAVEALRDDERVRAWHDARLAEHFAATGSRPWPAGAYPPRYEYADYLTSLTAEVDDGRL